MENLIERLQTEVGLTEDQAIKSVTIVKDFMDKEGIKIDWNKFFKVKYDEYMDKAKLNANKASRKVEDFSDKVSDKMEDLSIQAKRKARDLSKKVYDSLNDIDDDK